jgi:hypothetical protein
VVYNPTSSNLTGVTLQGTIRQGSVEVPAGGVGTVCPNQDVVAPGVCNVTFTVNPKSGEFGVINAGAADFALTFSAGDVVYDTKTVSITLTSP